MSRYHHAVDVSYPEAREDEVLTLLWSLGTIGVQELAPGRQRAFFATAATARVLALRSIPGVSASPRRIADEDWIRHSRQYLTTQHIGRLLIRTPWSRSRPRPGESLLVIDPARAFGTGGHESTRLALRALSAASPAKQRVLDVGCGSGILALAALRLGAVTAVALDFDAEATAATARNARRNDLSPLVVQGEIAAISGIFDLVLANLTLPLLLAEAGELARRVAPPGALVCAGLLTQDRDTLLAKLRDVGFHSFTDSGEGEWHAVVARRAASGS